MLEKNDVIWFDNRPLRKRYFIRLELLWIIGWGIVMGILFIIRKDAWLILYYAIIQLMGWMWIINNYKTAVQSVAISKAILYLKGEFDVEKIRNEQINWRKSKGEWLYLKGKIIPIAIDKKTIDEMIRVMK
jgi:hypothetical protein